MTVSAPEGNLYKLRRSRRQSENERAWKTLHKLREAQSKNLKPARSSRVKRTRERCTFVVDGLRYCLKNYCYCYCCCEAQPKRNYSHFQVRYTHCLTPECSLKFAACKHSKTNHCHINT